jgi:outer membrane protein assembly factor BamA
MLPLALALALSAGLSCLQQDPPSGEKEREKGKQSAPPPLKQEPGMSFYPMPAISADKDSGFSYGAVGALMFTNDNGVQDRLLSASINYHRLMRVNGEAEFRWYPTLSSTVDLDVYVAQRVENTVHVFYEDFKLDDRFHARFEALANRSATDHFFGVGDDTPHNAESVRTSNEYHVEARFGPRLTDHLDVTATLRWRHFRVGESLITDVPQMLALYPTQPGIEGGDLLAGGLRIAYDSRDSMTTPTEGVYATAYFERAVDFAPGAEHSFWLSGASVVSLWPLDGDKRFVTVVNVATQLAVGNTIPFWELPAIGGATTLRSYNGGRFTNKGAILFNIEERICLFEATLFDVSGQMQVAPFIDLGKVFDSSDDLFGRGIFRYHYTYGIGLRGVVPPSFVARLDIGLGGDEGAGITIGLDYPF